MSLSAPTRAVSLRRRLATCRVPLQPHGDPIEDGYESVEESRRKALEEEEQPERPGMDHQMLVPLDGVYDDARKPLRGRPYQRQEPVRDSVGSLELPRIGGPEYRRFRDPGTDGRHTDAVLGEFHRERLRVTHKGELRGRVSTETGEREQAQSGGDVHDMTAPARLERRQESAHEVYWPEQVYAEYPVPIVGRRVLERGEDADTSAVHEYVRTYLARKRGDLVRVTHVDQVGRGSDAGALDVGGDSL